MKYAVLCRHYVDVVIGVEADSEEEAEELANNLGVDFDAYDGDYMFDARECTAEEFEELAE